MVKSTFDEFAENMLKGEIIDLNNPNCTNCNQCCSITSMITEEEYTRLKKFLKTDKKGKELYKQVIIKFKKYIQEGTLNFMCPFSNSNRRCAIYNIRPKICRDFHCTEALRSKDYNRPEGHHHTIYDLFKKGIGGE